MANLTQITYDNVARREDLIDVITNISPQKTPLLSSLAMTTASNTFHEYLTDTLAASADNAQAEGSVFNSSTGTTPVRENNITQIVKKEIMVSGTEIEVDNAGMPDPFKYQIGKQTTEHAKDIEMALMASSRASGASGTARRMAGIINSVSTNYTARNSGATLGEAIFNDMMQNIYDSTDEEPTEVYVGGGLKRDISAFTANATKNVDIKDRRLVNAVDVYESDFGTVKILLHREVGSGAAAKDIVFLNPKFWKIAWLRRTKMEKLSKDGDRERAQMISELTLENLAESGSGIIRTLSGGSDL